MSFLLNNGTLPNMIDDEDLSLRDIFNFSRQAKEVNTVDIYCQGKAEPLLPFFKEVFSYEYESCPNYNYLRGLLLNYTMK